MKKLKKLLAGVLTLAMAMSMMTMTAFAAPATFDGTENGSLTIHKRSIESSQLEEYLKTASNANGEELSAAELENAGDALNGVTFTIYQVVDEEGLEDFYNSYPDDLPPISDYVTDGEFTGTSLLTRTEKTEGEGVAEFKNLPLGLYVVIETDPGALVTQAVAPFMVSIPMTKVDGSGWLYDVHVYPKNGTNTSGELTITKKGKTIGADGETTLDNVTFVLQKKNGNSWEDVTETIDESGKETELTLTTAGGGKITVSSLPDGDYRFIETDIKTNTETGENVGYIKDGATTYEFNVTKGKFSYGDSTDLTELEIEVVNEKPSFKKEVADKKDNYGKGADYNVGDTIDYKLTIGVPENITKLKTFYVVDTPTNLKDQLNSIKVWNGDVQVTEGFTSLEEGNGFRINFTPASLSALAGKTITITYQAILQEGALTTVDNPNDAKLVYSSNIVPEGDPDNPNKDDEPKVDEIVDTAYVYSYKLKVIKKAESESGEALADVEFDLYKESSDGTVTGDDATKLGLDSSKKWKKVNTSSLITGSDGTITQGGLENGTYYLVETKTNDNYNLLKAPVKVEIQVESSIETTTTTKTETSAEGEVTVTKTTVTVEHSGDQSDNAQGIWDQTVINKKGFTLPETGGMGTFVFTFVGIAMMAAAVILFITSKKKTVK